MKYVNVKPGAVPGIEVKDGTAYCEVSGRQFPITSFLPHAELGLIPMLGIPQMSDYAWQEMALQSRLKNPERYRETEDVEATITRLQRWLLEHSPTGEAVAV